MYLYFKFTFAYVLSLVNHDFNILLSSQKLSFIESFSFKEMAF